MYKLVMTLKRKAGLSVDEFQDYWLRQHAPLGARIPQVRRYVQTHPLPQGYSRGELICDAVGELWFDDEASYHAASKTEAFKRAAEDTPRFADTTTVLAFPVDVRVPKNGEAPADAIKSVVFARRRPDLGLEAFRRYWREHHGPLASRIASVRRYEQNHVRDEAYARGRVPAFDGFAVTWFASTDAMRDGATTEAYRATLADEPNFLAPGPLPVIIGREHIIALQA
jgi:uncharacterized protein (TIGR02118 family)